MGSPGRQSRNGLAIRIGVGLLAVAFSGGCTTLPELWNGPLDGFRHEHDADCGHAFLHGTNLDASPGDFAGADAWHGPLWENETRMKDPGRGDGPQPDRPVPWWVTGGGSSEHADRTPVKDGTETPRESGANPDYPTIDLQPSESAGQ